MRKKTFWLAAFAGLMMAGCDQRNTDMPATQPVSPAPPRTNPPASLPTNAPTNQLNYFPGAPVQPLDLWMSRPHSRHADVIGLV